MSPTKRKSSNPKSKGHRVLSGWFVEDAANDLTLELQRANGDRCYIVVKIDRMTRWIKPAAPPRQGDREAQTP